MPRPARSRAISSGRAGGWGIGTGGGEGEPRQLAGQGQIAVVEPDVAGDAVVEHEEAHLVGRRFLAAAAMLVIADRDRPGAQSGERGDARALDTAGEIVPAG